MLSRHGIVRPRATRPWTHTGAHGMRIIRKQPLCVITEHPQFVLVFSSISRRLRCLIQLLGIVCITQIEPIHATIIVIHAPTVHICDTHTHTRLHHTTYMFGCILAFMDIPYTCDKQTCCIDRDVPYYSNRIQRCHNSNTQRRSHHNSRHRRCCAFCSPYHTGMGAQGHTRHIHTLCTTLPRHSQRHSESGLKFQLFCSTNVVQTVHQMEETNQRETTIQ